VAVTWTLVFRVAPDPNMVMLRNVLTITAGS